jgi:hypothetical protein
MPSSCPGARASVDVRRHDHTGASGTCHSCGATPDIRRASTVAAMSVQAGHDPLGVLALGGEPAGRSRAGCAPGMPWPDPGKAFFYRAPQAAEAFAWLAARPRHSGCPDRVLTGEPGVTEHTAGGILTGRTQQVTAATREAVRGLTGCGKSRRRRSATAASGRCPRARPAAGGRTAGATGRLRPKLIWFTADRGEEPPGIVTKGPGRRHAWCLWSG